MKSKIGLVICLFLICSCDSHDFMLYRWRTIFYHIRHAIFSIEPIDSLSNSCSYYIVLRERKPHIEVDTLPLRKRIPHKFNAKERSPLTQKFQYKPLYIKLRPNTVYNNTWRDGGKSKHHKILSHWFFGQITSWWLISLSDKSYKRLFNSIWNLLLKFHNAAFPTYDLCCFLYAAFVNSYVWTNEKVLLCCWSRVWKQCRHLELLVWIS